MFLLTISYCFSVRYPGGSSLWCRHWGWGTWCATILLLLREKLSFIYIWFYFWFVRSLLIVGHHASGVFVKSVSLPLLPILEWFFYPLFRHKCSVISQVLSRGNHSICSCIYVVALGGYEFSTFLYHNFQMPPSFLYSLFL